MPQPLIIDLSAPISPLYWEPTPVSCHKTSHKKGAQLLARSKALFSNTSKLKNFMQRITSFLLSWHFHTHLPDKMGLSHMIYTLSTHTGTHLDSPFHYGWRERKGDRKDLAPFPPKTIDEIPLEWCLGPGILIDGSHTKAITRQWVVETLDKQCKTLTGQEIILFYTGADAYYGQKRYFTHYPHIEVEAIAWLLAQGIRVIGTDAFSFDPPFPAMLEAYERTQDQAVLWPAHILGRDHEYIQIERLMNLARLKHIQEFYVSCFPIKLEKGDAAWSRVVAISPEFLQILSNPAGPSLSSSHTR